ncbi:hypothetical protein [Anaplasma phagocytophilum]|uniref:hypothetical protein n=1 Tax=Anaplasma phagocytophilum TaxID=948 RepID=UPI00200FC8C1|nr:hypothetical protein [Anaplasma phagocytophilum]UQD54261.1 hypothetical protein ESP60_02410 [Anaplasma phagocytophilum]
MFDIFNDFATASVTITSCNAELASCAGDCSDFSVNDMRFATANAISRDDTTGSISYDLEFGDSHSSDELNTLDRDFRAVVIKPRNDSSDIKLSHITLCEILTNKPALYVYNGPPGSINDVCAQERRQYVSGLMEQSTSEYNENDGTLVITSTNTHSGCVVKVTLQKPKYPDDHWWCHYCAV